MLLQDPSTDSGEMDVMDEGTTSPADPNSDDLPPYLREDPPEAHVKTTSAPRAEEQQNFTETLSSKNNS
ncbi:transmembrane protein 263-B-like isoform X3 [Tachysurus ichikawai]